MNSRVKVGNVDYQKVPSLRYSGHFSSKLHLKHKVEGVDIIEP